MTLLSSRSFLSMRPKRGRKLASKDKNPKNQTLASDATEKSLSKEEVKKGDNKDENSSPTVQEKAPKSDNTTIPAKQQSNGKKKTAESAKIIEAELIDIIRKQREVFNSNPLPVVTKGKRGRPRKIHKINLDESENNLEPAAKKLKKDRSNSVSNDDAEKTNDKVKKSKSPTKDKDVNTKKDKSPNDKNDNSPNDKNDTSLNDKNDKDKSSSFVIFVTQNEGVKSKIFKCRICMKESSAKADLIKHIRVHTGERPFKCKICDASFVQVTALRGHEKIHTGEKPFICDVCGKKFAIKDRLRLHMRVHTGEKPHQCTRCDLSFARRSQVSQHMRNHSAVKHKFTCDECGSSFASYHTLKTHVNSHLGIKEFQCLVCGKKFLRVEGMYKHIRTVHRGNRPYTCNICGKAFKGHLQQHMRLHKGVRPYTCHLCDAAFTQNSQLTVHLRIHTGERPYKCQVCGSSFAHSSACKIHMRSHTGEKPFKCVLCNHAFSQLPHLKKHMKCVHGADKPYMCMLCKDFFKTQAEIDAHRRFSHNFSRSAEEEAQETVEEATLAKLRNRLAVLLYRISSEDRRTKFGFGSQLIDEVLKLSLESSGHVPISDPSLTPLEELRQNVLQLLRWTIPQETMEEYHRNNMTVDEVLDMLTS